MQKKISLGNLRSKENRNCVSEKEREGGSRSLLAGTRWAEVDGSGGKEREMESQHPKEEGHGGREGRSSAVGGVGEGTTHTTYGVGRRGHGGGNTQGEVAVSVPPEPAPDTCCSRRHTHQPPPISAAPSPEAPSSPPPLHHTHTGGTCGMMLVVEGVEGPGAFKGRGEGGQYHYGGGGSSGGGDGDGEGRAGGGTEGGGVNGREEQGCDKGLKIRHLFAMRD